MEKLKALRSEVERLKITIATLSKEQEMRSGRICGDGEGAQGQRTRSARKRVKKLAILDNELKEMDDRTKGGAAGEDREATTRNQQGLYKKLQALTRNLTKMSTEKGRLSSDMEKVERDLIEQEIEKRQIGDEDERHKGRAAILLGSRHDRRT